VEEKRIRIEKGGRRECEGRERGRMGGGRVHDEGGGRAEYGRGGEILKTLLLYLFIARPL
jgi:hypothetical protein